MSKKARTMDDARDLLFEAAERLRNATPEQLDGELLRAKGIGDLMSIAVESGKVEVMHARASGQPSGSGFLPAAPRAPELPEAKSPRLVGDGGKRS